MKKSKENVMERPVTLKSGVALQSNYSVQHRSDILMEEQIAAVRTGQTDLKKALSDLEVAKTEEEIDKCREVVQATKERSEKAIMVLQVLIKVNTELTFARAELDEALDKQEGDINESRKRVMWLEERMGILCGKARLRGQTYQKPAKSHIFSDRAFHSRMGSSSSTSSSENGFPKHGGFMGRNKSIEIKSITTGRPEMSPSESGSDYPPYQQQNRGLADTPSSGAESYLMAQKQMGGMRGPGMMQGPGMDDSDSESDTGIPPALQGMPAMAGPGVKSPESESESESSGSEYGDETETNVQPPKAYKQMPSEYTGSQVTYSVRYEDEWQAEQSEDGHGPVTQTEQVEKQAHDKEGQQVDDEQEDEEAETERDDDAGTEKEEGMSDREKSEVSERTESPQSSISGVSGEGLHNQQDIKDPTFITEVSFPRSVTIQTPRRDAGRPAHPRDEVHGKGDGADVLTLTQEESQEDLDLARDYWLSEHHRFEYSEYSEVLLELDPVSYHYVGLAMPGSFISRPEKGFVDLPWRSRRKGSDINDVHKTALDKLATRVHTMYDRFYDAALLSVRPSQTMDGRRETTMLSAFDNTRDGARSGTPTDSRPGMVTAPPTTADGMSRPQTVNAVIPPIKLKPGLNVYHPKPIPPPDMLPLTRTSKNKEYPRLADVFTEEDILVHKPAVRIVDQRNLYKETKLKLYRDRPKKEDDGPSTTEKKFRMMLEQEKSMGSKSSRSSRQTTARGPAGTRMSMTRTLTKADTSNRPESETGASTWSRLKPSSRGKEYGGLKWERVKTVVHVNLVSKRADERRDAAKHLGLLRCGDAMVFYALKERLRSDEDARTRYEAAKSLVLLGCWDEDVLQVILKYLVTGNTEVRQDLIHTMTDGKNVGYVNKKIPIFPELVKVLSHFCRSPDPDDTNSFDAAVLLGKLCVADENAKFKLLRSLDQSMDTHVKAKALDVLVKQLSCASWEVVQHLLSLFRESPVWKYRALAADLLIILGKEQVCKRGEEEKIYLILERKLWDDPTKDVRVSAAKALAALGMFSKACDRIEKRLEDTDEDIRAQAVISVGTLEMKNEKIIRLLLEMLELDASEYVRLMICRTFTTLKLTDKRILRALRERDKVEGALARESRKALKVLECLATLPRLTSPTGRRSMASRATPRGTTPRYTPAVTA